MKGRNPTNSQVSTSDSLTLPPPALLPVSPLVAPANTLVSLVSLGGLGVTCLHRDSRFAGSNPTEVDGFLGRKNPEHRSSGMDFKLGIPSLRFLAR